MSRSTSSDRRVVLIVASGRSGTSWLGSILASNPDTFYKYEPFPRRKGDAYSGWLERLESGAINGLADELEDLFARGYISIDRPPFVGKAYSSRNRTILEALYRLGSRFEAADGLFERYARFDIPDEMTAVIKDVSIGSDVLPRLVEAINIDVVTIVRHPMGTVNSALRGMEAGTFGRYTGDNRAQQVVDLIDRHEGRYCGEWRDRVHDLDQVKLSALRWRIDNEPMFDFVSGFDRGYVVVYEALADDPLGRTAELFAKLGWSVSDETRDFVTVSSTASTTGGTTPDQYFGVERDSAAAARRWSGELSDYEVSAIAEVTAESPLMRLWETAG